MKKFKLYIDNSIKYLFESAHTYSHLCIQINSISRNFVLSIFTVYRNYFCIIRAFRDILMSLPWEEI